jgi:hypothetical protein
MLHGEIFNPFFMLWKLWRMALVSFRSVFYFVLWRHGLFLRWQQKRTQSTSQKWWNKIKWNFDPVRDGPLEKWLGWGGGVHFLCLHFFPRLSAVYVCLFKNMSSRNLNKSDACIFFQTLFVCMDFFLFFPHPPHH